MKKIGRVFTDFLQVSSLPLYIRKRILSYGFAKTRRKKGNNTVGNDNFITQNLVVNTRNRGE